MTNDDKKNIAIIILPLVVIAFVKLTILHFSSDLTANIVLFYNNVSGNELVYGGSIPWFFPIIRTIGIIILIALYLLFVFYIISRTKFESSFKILIIIMCPFITINFIGIIIMMIFVCMIFDSEFV